MLRTAAPARRRRRTARTNDTGHRVEAGECPERKPRQYWQAVSPVLPGCAEDIPPPRPAHDTVARLADDAGPTRPADAAGFSENVS
jgi:hypothetical protein